jgi:hypothetical protein
LYETLERLPGLAKDEYGNLNVAAFTKRNCGLRHRVDYALQAPRGTFTGTKLSDLLDWMRWGSECSVMWECTLPELIQVIEKWLGDNADAPQELFGLYGDPAGADWNKLWTDRGIKDEVLTKRQCQRCGKIYREFDDCDKCYIPWYEMETVMVGPRGPHTYNLVLMGAAGYSIAAAVWNNRNWLFAVPEDFVLNPYNHYRGFTDA